jgi:hypothetical protein
MKSQKSTESNYSVDKEELYFSTSKKYLKDNIVGKEELMEKHSYVIRNLPKNPTAPERTMWFKASDALAECSGFKKDNRQTADNVIICFGFTPGQKIEMKKAGPVAEKLPELADSTVIEVKKITRAE